MAKFTKESIQRLREAVDIVDIITRSVPLKRSGASYKGLCPFHAEKSPSFTVTRSSRHYHCFGCGAHGDAVSFLMQHEGLTFTQSLEFLSERYSIPLEEDRTLSSLRPGNRSYEQEGKRARLKQLLETAKQFFHLFLLFAPEAQPAREYLMKRGLSLSFLQAFQIGYAPHGDDFPSRRYLNRQGFSDEELQEAGLLSSPRERSSRVREFFQERVVFPILDHMGNCVGFSARKIREETFGGKYINTPETMLFKKSKILFGLPYCKKRIVRDGSVLLVEGQLDALRLIHSGFDFTVATLGTAFGEQHVDVLKILGVDRVYIAFDSDAAGVSSAKKAGDLLLKKGIGVSVVSMQGAKDPDEYLIRYSRSQFLQILKDAPEFIEFYISHLKSNIRWESPNEKDKALRELMDSIKEWENPILIHESLKKVASLSNIPLELTGIQDVEKEKKAVMSAQASLKNMGFIASFSPLASAKEKGVKKGQGAPAIDVDADLELDLIRWMALLGGEMADISRVISDILTEADFTTSIGKEMYKALHKMMQSGSVQEFTLLDLASEIDADEAQEAYIAHMIAKPPIRMEKSHQYVYEAIRRIKDRAWVRQREEIRRKMVDEHKSLSEEEQMILAQEFARIRPPELPPMEEMFPSATRSER